MHRLTTAVVVLLFTGVVSAQQQIELLELSPRSGPSGGGTRVTIRLSGIPNCPILPLPPTVSFGGVVGEDLNFGREWTVLTPPHDPGLVDVVISACGMEDIVVPRGFAYFGQSGSNPFDVQTVTPAFGPSHGGTEVTVKVDQIPFCFDPIPPATLVFGGIEATNVREDTAAGTITGVTPAHAPGPVDLTVRTCGGPSVTLQSGFTYGGFENPNPAYEKVLFPVVFHGPGAQGSEWSTRILVYNAGTSTITTPNAVFSGDPTCPRVCGCANGAEALPAETKQICIYDFSDPAGLLFYAPRSAAQDLHYHGRVFDWSRSTKNAGTEIPAVREGAFRTDEIVLMDLPLDPNFRLNLRVYNPDQVDGAQVRMQILEPDRTGVIGERLVTLVYSIVTIAPDPYPHLPAFAYVGDLDGIVRSMISPGEYSSFHVKLTPVTEGIRFWAFASMTNNETQLITTVTPTK